MEQAAKARARFAWRPGTRRAAQAPTLTQKISRWVTIAAGIILIGLLKVYIYMVPQMPACADSNTADVIRDIFKKKTSR